MKTKGGDGMNDKQKELALEMAVVRARMSMEHLAVNDYNPLKKELTELLAAFDAAADAPKRKYTVADIKKPQQCVGMNGDYWYIRCVGNDWTSVGWVKQREGSSGFKRHVADVIYAGLVATGNVPEVGE